MTVITTQLVVQTDKAQGLQKIYYGDWKTPSVYLEFDTKKNATEAFQDISNRCAFTWMIKDKYSKKEATEKGALDILRSDLIPKDATGHVIGYTAKSGGGVGLPIETNEMLIQRLLESTMAATTDLRAIVAKRISDKDFK